MSGFGCSGRLALLLLLLLLLGGDAGGHGRAAVAGAAPHEPIYLGLYLGFLDLIGFGALS